MSTLDLSPRLSDPDTLFEALVEAHHGLAPDASRRLDAKLVLLLANHIGDDPEDGHLSRCIMRGEGGRHGSGGGEASAALH